MISPIRHEFPANLEYQALEFQDECRDKLRGIMVDDNISQRELSRRTSLDSETIRRFLSGRKGTTLRTYAGLVAATGKKLIFTFERGIEMAATRSPSNMSCMRDYALAHKEFTLQEAMEVLGLTKKQVHGAISNLRHTNQIDLKIVTPGQLWRWDSNTWAQISSNRRSDEKAAKTNAGVNEVTGNTFDLLATTKTGALVLQDGEGNLFRAERL